MEFNPKILTPFKRAVIQQFPFIEADFDALTNYGLLSKIVEYLNDILDSQNEVNEQTVALTNAFNELKSYVDSYFDNLDVQEEINNKLDQMVEDGTFQEIVNVYFVPFKEEVNNTLSNFQQQLLTIASGTPIPVSSVSEMTDTTKAYLLTTTGDWYYYDGNSWQSGGTYQAIKLNDNEVHYNNLDNELQSSFSDVTNTTDVAAPLAGFVNPNGTINSNSSYAHYEMNVNAFERYDLHINYGGYQDSNVAIQFLDQSDNVVLNKLKSDVTVTNNYMIEKVIVPFTATKMRINTVSTPNALYTANYILKIASYDITDINVSQLSSELQDLYQPQFEEVSLTTFITGAYFSTTNITSYATANILSLNVNPGEVYRVTMKQLDYNPAFGFTTENKTVTKTIGGNEYSVKNIVDYVSNPETQHQYTNYIFTVPKYCKTIYFNYRTSNPLPKIEKCVSYKINASDVITDYDKVGFEKLYMVGDSITEVNFRANHNYLYWISQDIPSLSITNLGVGGTGYKRTIGAGNNTFTDRLAQISTYNLDTDVICVMGSVNDVSYAADSLGELGDTTMDTLYGAMYTFFNALFTRFNGVRVGCISPINWKNSNINPNFPKYLKALEDTCNLFNVPYLDIHNICNLRPNDETFRNEYYLSDGAGHTPEVDENGTHPNSKGHHLFYGRIKKFLLGL